MSSSQQMTCEVMEEPTRRLRDLWRWNIHIEFEWSFGSEDDFENWDEEEDEWNQNQEESQQNSSGEFSHDPAQIEQANEEFGIDLFYGRCTLLDEGVTYEGFFFK